MIWSYLPIDVKNLISQYHTLVWLRIHEERLQKIHNKVFRFVLRDIEDLADAYTFYGWRYVHTNDGTVTNILQYLKRLRDRRTKCFSLFGIARNRPLRPKVNEENDINKWGKLIKRRKEKQRWQNRHIIECLSDCDSLVQNTVDP
jgi:hypothetical protein